MVQATPKESWQENCEFSDEDIQRICETFLSFQETEQSKIFPNRRFGYWKVNVERPLRLRVDLDPESLVDFRKACAEAKESALADIIDNLAIRSGPGPHMEFNLFTDRVETLARQSNYKSHPRGPSFSNRHSPGGTTKRPPV